MMKDAIPVPQYLVEGYKKLEEYNKNPEKVWEKENWDISYGYWEIREQESHCDTCECGSERVWVEEAKGKYRDDPDNTFYDMYAVKKLKVLTKNAVYVGETDG